MSTNAVPPEAIRLPPGPAGGGVWPGLGFVVVTALFFGSGPTLARLAFDGGTGVLTLQIARFLVAAIGLWAWLLISGRVRPIPRSRIPLVGAMVLLSTGASFGYMTSVRSIPVPVASLIFFTFPLMVGPLAHLIGDERLSLRRVAALGVGFSGLALVLGGGMAGADPLGLALAFGGGTCVAVSFQVSRRLTVDIAPTQLTAIMAAGSGLVCLVALAVHAEIHLPETARGWVGILGNAVSYAVGLTCLFAAIRRLGSVRTAIVINLEPVVSVALAAAVLGEALGGMQLLGGAVVLAGILLAQSERRSAPRA